MTVSVRYIGPLNPYFEVSVTGKPTKWTPGRTGDVSDGDAALLIATGVFEVYADRVLPFVFDQAGGIAGVRLGNGLITPLGGSTTPLLLDGASHEALGPTGPYLPIAETRHGAAIPGWVPENLTDTGLICYAPCAAIGVNIIASSSGVIELREGSASGRLLTKASLAVTAGTTVYIAGSKGAERLSGDLWLVRVSGTVEIEPLFEAIDGVMIGDGGEDIVLDPGTSGLIYLEGPRILSGATIAANWAATVASSIHILVGRPCELLGLRVIASASGVINLYEGTGTDGRRIIPASTALTAGTNLYPWGEGVLRRLNGGVAMQLVSGTCEVAPLFRTVEY